MVNFQDLRSRDVKEGDLVILINPRGPFKSRTKGIVLGPFERYVKNYAIFSSYFLWPNDAIKPALYISSTSSALGRAFPVYSEGIYVGEKEVESAIKRRPYLRIKRDTRILLVDSYLVSLLSDVRLSTKSKQDVLLSLSKPVRSPHPKKLLSSLT